MRSASSRTRATLATLAVIAGVAAAASSAAQTVEDAVRGAAPPRGAADPSPARAARFAEAVAAFDAGDPARAAAIWRELAETGDPHAMENLARLLDAGRGVPPDAAEARRWRRRAATFEAPAVWRARAEAYLSGRAGRGRPEDVQIAVAWYARAAEAGDRRAQYAYGAALWRGLADPPAPDAARVWLRRAADAGDPNALALLERIDAETRAPAATPVRRVSPRPAPVRRISPRPAPPGSGPRILRIETADAAPTADPLAADIAADLAVAAAGVVDAPPRSGPRIARIGPPSPAGARARNAATAARSDPRADAAAVAQARRLLSDGRAMEAARLLRPLAARGVAAAAHLLGRLYLDGFGVPRDRVRAAQLWTDAAGAGSTPAADDLAELAPALSDAEAARLRAAASAAGPNR